MGFYDDGGVDFAQKQFDESRKRREKTAKSQNKFSRNLTILDGLIGLGTKVINKNADKLETEGILARSNSKQAMSEKQDYNDPLDFVIDAVITLRKEKESMMENLNANT